MERGLEGDRRWMLVDAKGRFLTQRKYPQMALIEVEWEPGALVVRAPGNNELIIEDAKHQLDQTVDTTIWSDQVPSCTYQSHIDDWFSRVLNMRCHLVKRGEALRQVDTAFSEPGQDVSFADGFPYLLTNTASLDDLNQRLDEPVTMLRFRPNLVVHHTTAFAEDNWQSVRVGELEFHVKKPCSRCILTTVDPSRGVRDANREPLSTLSSYRTRGNEVYFGENLIVHQPGSIAIGDAVSVLEESEQ